MLVMGALNVALSIALVRGMGILGVALGTAIPNVLFAALLLVLVCRDLDVRPARYLAYVGGRALVGAVPVAALGLWLKLGLEVQGALPLVLSGAAMVALFTLVWVGFVYRGDPYLDLRPVLARLRGAKP
jgi:Na+-driven multidrug efflux pump